ncbi:ABC transporter substrate-binding protein [Duganella sp. Root198D2]|uniref:substrate-binding periplasmic protein n=1 Tax=Duganella sp. Root198D2 TaxID=1736489 RepID=UPI001E4BE984|nr:transporter substrate-binding domain-containing protein [Duganella sp. Root198D2]
MFLARPVLALAGVARKMQLVTSHLPSLVHESGQPGGLQEIVAELCQRAGVRPATQFVPWRRAQFLATTMPATAIYPLTRLPEREAQYRWLVPLFEENYVLLAVRGKLLPLEQMKEKRIALLRGAAQAAILKEQGFTRLVEASSIDEVHRFLLGGMADAAFGERRIISASLKGQGASESGFETSAPVGTSTAWLAGSLDFDATDVGLFQRALESMQADGTLRRILARHKLT